MTKKDDKQQKHKKDKLYECSYCAFETTNKQIFILHMKHAEH